MLDNRPDSIVNREKSTQIKGVAILMMIFFHLFNQLHNVELCRNYIYINDSPLVYVLSHLCNPVGLFLLLGGYGLYKVWAKGDRNRWKRILRLYIHYWIILLIFVSIGHFVKPDLYPGDISKLLENFTSYKTSYNGELWFLLPYAIISASSPFICSIISKSPWCIVVSVTLCTKLTAAYIATYYADNAFVANQCVTVILQALNMLFNFSLGVLAAMNHWFEMLAIWLESMCRSLKIRQWCAFFRGG